MANFYKTSKKVDTCKNVYAKQYPSSFGFIQTFMLGRKCWFYKSHITSWTLLKIIWRERERERVRIKGLGKEWGRFWLLSLRYVQRWGTKYKIRLSSQKTSITRHAIILQLSSSWLFLCTHHETKILMLRMMLVQKISF